MEYNWVMRQVDIFKGRAVDLAVWCDMANTNYRRESTEKNLAEARAVGAAMHSLFEEIWQSLQDGFQDEYDEIVRVICLEVEVETGVDVRIFAH